MSERLQKWLAAAGVASRRQAEKLIEEGRVEVNGKVVGLGTKVEGDERIKVDGKPVRHHAPKRAKLLLYHKPAGEICTRDDPEGRRTIFESLPRRRQGRWITVGRLDFQTSGLLLITDSGDVANKLMHPSSGLQRQYAVRILGEPGDEVLERLRNGIRLDDGPAKFEHIEDAGGDGANRWYRVTVSEGRNRIVRRMWEAEGFVVSRLTRVAYGPIELPRKLRRGKFRDALPGELKALQEAVSGLKFS